MRIDSVNPQRVGRVVLARPKRCKERRCPATARTE